MAPLVGDDAWVVSAGLVDDGITLWCQRPHWREPRLAAPSFESTLSDDAGTDYAFTGGSMAIWGDEGPELCRLDFAPRPPEHVISVRLHGRFSIGAEVNVDFPVAFAPIAATEEMRAAFGEDSTRPRRAIPCRAVVDPDGAHPVCIFGVETWTRETVIWAQWHNAKGARYVLFAGGCRWPLGNGFYNTPPGVSADRIQLPFVLSDEADSLEVKIRLRGNPGFESTSTVSLCA